MLTKTKKRTLKCTTRQCNQWKVLQCWLRMGHLLSFCVPATGHLAAQVPPPPGICHARQKKRPITRGGWERGAWCTCNWLMHKLANTVEPWDNEPPYNKVLGSTNNFLYPSNSKIYGKGPWCKEHPLIIRFSVPRPFVILRFHCSIFGDW